MEEGDAGYEDDSVGEVGGFCGGDGSGNDTEEKREENGTVGEELPLGGQVDEAEEEGAGQKDEGEIELELRSEEDEEGKDDALRSAEAELIGHSIRQEGEQEEAEGTIGHLDVFEWKRGEDQGLEEVAAADAGHDAALAEGIGGVVVELKHLDGRGEIKVVVVGGLILAGVDAGAKPGDEDDGEQEEQEGDGAGGGCREIAGFGLRFGFGEGDAEEHSCEQTEEDQGEEDWGGDGADEIEAAAEEDHDTDTAGCGERDGWAVQAEETEKDGTVARDREKEERTPEECLDEMQERS